MTRLEARKAAVAACETIDGWLTDREAGQLFDLAADATGPIVEIGSWQGRSTAALALGSMAGNKQPVYAVDSFIGVPPTDRVTANGVQPGWGSSSPEILRANLDRVGVNGLVKIVPKASADAVEDVPSCSVLFVDGAHDYASAKRDLQDYLPKVTAGGHVLVHDCWELDMDVVRAVDDTLLNDPLHWRMQRRIDSAILAQRRETKSHKVFLAIPGGKLDWGSAKGMANASLGAHQVTAVQSGNGWDDMNFLWVQALNALEAGKFTHFAMLHNDVAPQAGWLDTLLCELEDNKADLVSTVVPLKDMRGLVSSGIGDKDDHWNAFRRFTMKELADMPQTFGIKDTPHPDRYLLHNTGCWAADLRNPLWRALDAQGRLIASFAFPVQARRGADGTLCHERESEDWYFSRQLHRLGMKTFCTRKVEVDHIGALGFSNTGTWGAYEHDKDTQAKWEPSVLNKFRSADQVPEECR